MVTILSVNSLVRNMFAVCPGAKMQPGAGITTSYIHGLHGCMAEDAWLRSKFISA